MSRKSDLTFKKKQELVDIILRKDNVEKELKDKNEELSCQVSKLTDEIKSSNLKISNLTNEKKELQSKNNSMHTELENKDFLINNLSNANYSKIVMIICVAIAGIIGWIL